MVGKYCLNGPTYYILLESTYRGDLQLQLTPDTIIDLVQIFEMDGINGNRKIRVFALTPNWDLSQFWKYGFNFSWLDRSPTPIFADPDTEDIKYEFYTVYMNIYCYTSKVGGLAYCS